MSLSKSRNIKLTEFDSLHPENYSNAIVTRILRAKTVALQSTMRNKHGSVLMQSGSVLAVGVNSSSASPGSIQFPSVHAEVAATRLHRDIPNTVLYVVRAQPLHKTHNNKAAVGTDSQLPIHMQLAMSQPCPECMDYLIFKTQVKEIVYSI